MSQDNPITNHVQPAFNKAENAMGEVLDKKITAQSGDNQVEGFASSPARVAADGAITGARAGTSAVEGAVNILGDVSDAGEALVKGVGNKFTPWKSEYKAAHQPKPQLADTLGGTIANVDNGIAYQGDRALETLSENTGRVTVEKRLDMDPESTGGKVAAAAINVAVAPFAVAGGGLAFAAKVGAHAVGAAGEVAAAGEHGIKQIFTGIDNLISEPQARIKPAETEEQKIAANTHIDAPITQPAQPIKVAVATPVKEKIVNLKTEHHSEPVHNDLAFKNEKDAKIAQQLINDYDSDKPVSKSKTEQTLAKLGIHETIDNQLELLQAMNTFRDAVSNPQSHDASHEPHSGMNTKTIAPKSLQK